MKDEDQRRDEERLAREQERLKAAYDNEQRKERKSRDSAVVEASSQDVVVDAWTAAKQQPKLRRSMERQRSIRGTVGPLNNLAMQPKQEFGKLCVL